MAMISEPSGNDVIGGPVDGDVIVGGGGDDNMYVGVGVDNVTLDGGPGNDSLQSGGNNNTLIGGPDGDSLESMYSAGNTTMVGGPGSDILVGGGANDTASYANDPAGVAVDLSSYSATDGTGGADLLLWIENVTGSGFADSLTGDDYANVLQGGAGDDALMGGAGADIFQYSFNLTQSSGGGSTTSFKFTDWLSGKTGKDFGDHLPDYAAGHHHHHHHKHGKKDDKHDAKHAKHDAKHDKHDAKHDKHDDKHDKHEGHHHKHGEDSSHEHGLTQSFFAKSYKEWLETAVVADLLARGLAQDVNGNGKIDVKLNQNDSTGTPFIEGLSAEELAGMFSDRDGVVVKHGHHTHERFYSNEATLADGGETVAAVASGDGFDTIVDFGNGADKLQFDFTADANWADGQADPLAYLESFFNIDRADFTSDGVADTRLSVDMNNDGNAEWSAVLAGNDMADAQVFAALDVYVNGILIG